MGREPVLPALINSKTLNLMITVRWRMLLWKRTGPRAPRDATSSPYQTFAQGPLAKHKLIHTKHLHCPQDQYSGNNTSPAFIQACTNARSGVIATRRSTTRFSADGSPVPGNLRWASSSLAATAPMAIAVAAVTRTGISPV